MLFTNNHPLPPKKNMVSVLSSGKSWSPTVDGSEIRLTRLRLVVEIPLFTRPFFTSQVVQDFFHQPYCLQGAGPFFGSFDADEIPAGRCLQCQEESVVLLMVQKSQGQPPFGWC